jgi:hypothetical protein
MEETSPNAKPARERSGIHTTILRTPTFILGPNEVVVREYARAGGRSFDEYGTPAGTGDGYLASLPPELRIPGALEEIRSRVAESGRRIVVLDDDPTGTQTVHGVPVLTT